MVRAWYRCAIILITLLCFETANSTLLRSESSEGLVFEVLPLQSTIPLGKPIYLKFELRNTGSENALVNRRFYLNDTVSLEIAGPTGHGLTWCGRIFQIEVSQGDFVFLAPGARVEKVVLVSCNKNKTSGYTFSVPGQYVIKAQYQLPFPKGVLEKAARGAVVVKGPISAKPVQIALVTPE